MLFALGYIAGLLTATFIAVVLVFFKKPLMLMGTQLATKVELAGPRPSGFVFEPESEAEVVRKAHIAANAAEGKDTPIDELK